MTKKEITTPYLEYSLLSELGETDQRLAEHAIKAMSNAYAPYSNFYVGAAVMLDDGTIITGNNQENAAYPSGMCAERVALFYANAQHPHKKIIALAIVAGKNGVINHNAITPCGGCRQVMTECEHRQNGPFPVILVGKSKIIRIEKASYLLPFEFDASSLVKDN